MTRNGEEIRSRGHTKGNSLRGKGDHDVWEIAKSRTPKKARSYEARTDRPASQKRIKRDEKGERSDRRREASFGEKKEPGGLVAFPIEYRRR